MSIDQVEYQSAVSVGGGSLSDENDCEGVAGAAGPGVVPPRVDVGPVFIWVGLTDNKQSVLGVFSIALRAKRKFTRVVVGRADLPQTVGGVESVGSAAGGLAGLNESKGHKETNKK